MHWIWRSLCWPTYRFYAQQWTHLYVPAAEDGSRGGQKCHRRRIIFDHSSLSRYCLKILPIMSKAAAKAKKQADDGTHLSEDQRTVLRLLSKFDLSPGAFAEVFVAYLNVHPAKDADLDAFRRALRGRATEAQKRILDATGPLLTSEEIGDRLGYNSGRRMPNNMKRDRELLAISVAQKRGKIKRFLSRRS
jgi:hypothetical protein